MGRLISIEGLKFPLSPIVKQVGAIALLLFIAYLVGFVVATGDMRFVSLLVAGVLLIVAVWHQKLLLYSFVVANVWFYSYFSYTEQPLLYLGANVYLGDLFIFLILGSTVISAFSKEGHHGLRSPLGIAVALYIAWAMISVVRGIPRWGHSAVGESRFVMWACVYFLVVQSIRDQEGFNRFLKFFLLTVFSYLVYLQVWRYLVEFRGDLGLMLRSRLMGADSALLVVSIFVFSLSVLLAGRLGKRAPGIFLLAVVSGVLVPFGARTAWIALAVSTGFVIIFLGRKAGVKKGVVIALIALILAGTFVNLGLFGVGGLLDPGVEKGLGFATEAGRIEGTTAWRLFGWKMLISHTLRGDPVFGEAFGGYYDIFEVELKGVPPHNDWLIIFSKMGLIGIALFLAIVVRFYRVGFEFVGRSGNSLQRAYMQGLLSVFLVGLVGGTFFAFFPFMWIATGMQTALVGISHRNDTLNAVTHNESYDPQRSDR